MTNLDGLYRSEGAPGRASAVVRVLAGDPKPVWAVVSIVGFILMVTSTHEEKSRVAAWVWLTSFSASALVAAYYFWRLL